MSYDEKTMKELESKTFDIVPRGKASKRGILKLSKRLTELILKNGHSIWTINNWRCLCIGTGNTYLVIDNWI